jgi:hypothetical protein
LPTPGRAAEQEGANRLARIAEAGTGHLDRLGQRVNRLVLTKNDRLQVAVEILQGAAVIQRDVLRRNAGNLGDDLLDIGLVDHFFLLRFGQDSLRGTRLVDDINRLVRQVAVGDVTGRQVRCRGDRCRGVFDAVVGLEAGLEALENLNSFGNDGSLTSIFWKRRESALSFSKIPRNSV